MPKHMYHSHQSKKDKDKEKFHRSNYEKEMRDEDLDFWVEDVVSKEKRKRKILKESEKKSKYMEEKKKKKTKRSLDSRVNQGLSKAEKYDREAARYEKETEGKSMYNSMFGDE